jgi:protein-tyrosine phosphatase
VNGTKLYWVDGPWPGKLALAARPRGGDWLEDEIIAWKRMGVDAVLSLLTADEERDLALADEGRTVQNNAMQFISLPIPDRQVPYSETELTAVLDFINVELSSGKNVVIHCRQGIGRSGLVAVCLLATKGMSTGSAVQTVTLARGVPIPETPEQRNWIDHYASILPTLK